ncbi:CobW family GTP-binding protein [Azotobacter beijerinckii]|nr:GTP-binding protein [Azotobacter beijerinckii]
MNGNSDVVRDSTIPVTVLTGFLGSGKTTMLAKLLRSPRFAHTAVIINEFGEVGLDHELLEQSREELVLLANGCVCCTVRGDLVATLEKLHEQHVLLGIDRVVVETTGLADPAPILHTLMADPRVTAKFRLEHLVTSVDAYNGLRTLDAHPVALKQAAVADRIVLTKVDLVDAFTLKNIKERLKSINKIAPIHVAQQGEIDPDLLFLNESSGREHVKAASWLGDQYWFHHEDRHHRVHTHHHAGEHDSGIRSYSIVRDEPVSWQRFATWLELISSMRGDDLLRVKGIVNVLEHPDQPIVVHGVQHVFHPYRTLEKWPGKDRRTRLVFITRNIDREDIETTLQVFESKK